MKERPILFSGEMVRAILDGRKTQTRRIVKGEPAAYLSDSIMGRFVDKDTHLLQMCPYGKPGDRLWVRETFAPMQGYRPIPNPEKYDNKPAWYRADNDRPTWAGEGWKPSIHMPRAFSRLTLEITDVRVERLHQISDGDAKAEGIAKVGYTTSAIEKVGGPEIVAIGCWKNYLTAANPFLGPRESFESLWQSINGRNSWSDNPWVWVVTFSKTLTNARPLTPSPSPRGGARGAERSVALS